MLYLPAKESLGGLEFCGNIFVPSKAEKLKNKAAKIKNSSVFMAVLIKFIFIFCLYRRAVNLKMTTKKPSIA